MKTRHQNSQRHNSASANAWTSAGQALMVMTVAHTDAVSSTLKTAKRICTCWRAGGLPVEGIT